MAASASALHGPVGAQAGLDGAEAGHAGRLAQRREPARAEVDRVQGEAEGGAVLEARALEVGRGRRLGRAASPRTARSRPRRCGRAVRGRRRDAAAARISSVSAIAHDQHRPARVVEQAGRDAAQHRGAERRAAAAAGHDRARVELVGELDQGGEERAGRGARRAARRRSRRRGPARRPRRPAPRRSRGPPRRAPDVPSRTMSPGSASRAAGAAPSKVVQAVATTAGTVLEHGAGVLDRRLGVVGSVVGDQHGPWFMARRMSFARLAEPLGPPAGARP